VGEDKAADAIRNTSVKNLDIIPSNIDLSGAEIELVSMDNREKVLKSALGELRNHYDYILIDCPPSLALLTVNAITVADSILIPIQGEFFALEGLSQLMNTIKLAKKYLNPSLDVEGVVLTMFDGRSNIVNNVADEILKVFGKKVFATRIPRNIRLVESTSYGLPIMQYEPRSTGSLAYLSLAEELLKRNNDTFTPIKNIGSLKKQA
jgi:chromosome partitioning protein